MKKVLIALMGIGLGTTCVWGETYIWTPTTSIDGIFNWSTPANWQPNISEEGFESDAIAVIAGEAPQAVTFDKDSQICQLKIDNADTTVNLGGRTLSLTSSTSASGYPISLGGGTVEGPLNVVISNGTIAAKYSQKFISDSKNESSTVLLDNIAYTNTVGTTSVGAQSTLTVRDSKFVVTNKDANVNWEIGAGSTLIFEGPKTDAKMHTKAGRFNFYEDSVLIVSNKAKAAVINGYVQFPKPGGAIIVDGATWNHEVSGFYLNSNCRIIAKNGASFTAPRINMNLGNTGSHDTTNVLFEISGGSKFTAKNYPIFMPGVDGFGGNKFFVDGEGSELMFNISRDSQAVTVSSSNNIFRATNKGLLNFYQDKKYGTNQVITIKSSDNVVEAIDASISGSCEFVRIGFNGTNNVLSLVNSSTLSLSNRCSFILGPGEYARDNALRVSGEGNKIVLTGKSNFCASNSSEMVFVMTDNMTYEKPMLEMTSTSTGRIILDGFTSAQINDAVLREGEEKGAVTLLKIPTEKFDPCELTAVLTRAVGKYGELTCSSDETHTYWTYQIKKPGFSIIIR